MSDQPKESTYRIEGDAVVSFNQQGGQTAREIHNYGPPKRTITPAIRRRMLSILEHGQRSSIGFASTQGDVEAHEFKLQLMRVFQEAGWDVHDQLTFMFFGAKRGIVLTIPFSASENGVPQLAAAALSQTGAPVSGNRGDMANEHGMYVQVWTGPER